MFLLYFGIMSMVTPPVALSAFAAANIAGADPTRTGFTATRIGWAAYVVPFLFALSPSLLLRGHPLVIAWAALTAAIGIWLGTLGAIGYLAAPLGRGVRVLLFAAGILTLFPADMFAGAWLINVAGLGLGALLVGRELASARARA
jgi:TRAP-type uncharacterized transport system fused permease subunit